jgi:hypothetical protein
MVTAVQVLHPSPEVDFTNQLLVSYRVELDSYYSSGESMYLKGYFPCKVVDISTECKWTQRRLMKSFLLALNRVS